MKKTMKRNSFYAFMAMALTTVSCTTNEVPENKPTDQAITIVAEVSPQSRAPQLNMNGSGTFAKGDVMTLFVADDISMNYAYQQDVLTWGGLQLSDNVSDVKISACYPKQTLLQDKTFEFNALTASDKDLLLSPVQTVKSGTADAVHLSFRHALHCLNLSFTAGNGYSTDDLKTLSLSLNAKTTCVVDAFQGIITEVKAVKGDYTSTGAAASFYLVPQSTEDVSLNITVGNDNKSLSLNDLFQQLGEAQANLNGGAQCSITLKISRDGIVVESGSIGAWENQVTVDGELTIG